MKSKANKNKTTMPIGSSAVLGCRHRNTWLIAGGYYEWCYECGGIRKMKVSAPNVCCPETTWCKPTGKDGDNPWGAWMKSTSLYKERQERKQPNDLSQATASGAIANLWSMA
jgi:hypothetical protein